MEEFYEMLKANGIVPSEVDFDNFSTKLKDEKSRKEFYDMLQTQKVVPQEVDYKTFNTRLGFKNKGVLDNVVDYFKDSMAYVGASVEQAWNAAGDASLINGFETSVDEATNMSKEDVKELSQSFAKKNKINRVLEKTGGGEGDIGGYNGMVFEAFEKLGDLSLSVFTSGVGMVKNIIDNPVKAGGIIAAATTAGAGGGAALGSVTGPGALATGIVGGLIGFKQGIGGVQSISSASMESSSHIVGEIEQYAFDNDLDVTNEADLQKILSDKTFMSKTLSDAAIKGTVVAGTEAAGNMIAPGFGKFTSKLLKPLVKSKVSNQVLREGGASLVEGIAGASGSILGSVGIGEEINWDAALDEGLAEVLPGGVVRGINNQADRIVNRKAHNVREGIVNAAVDGNMETYMQHVETARSAGTINDQQAQVLTENAMIYQDLARSAPAEILQNRTDRKEFIELSAERLSVDEAISQQQELLSTVDETLKPKVQEEINKLEKARGKINKSLTGLVGDDRIANVADDAEYVHNLKTKTVMAANQLGQPLTRADVEVYRKEDGTYGVNVQGKPIPSQVNNMITERVVEEAISGEDEKVKALSDKMDKLYQTFIDNGKTDEEATTLTISSLTPEERQIMRDGYNKTTTPVDSNYDLIFGEDTPSETTATATASVDTEVVEQPVLEDTLNTFDTSNNRAELEGRRVNYGGIEGTVRATDEGFVVEAEDGSTTLIEGGLSDTSNFDLGITEVVENEVTYDPDSKKITSNGKDFQVLNENRDKDGTLKSLKVKDSKGKIKTIKTAKALEAVNAATAPAPAPAPAIEAAPVAIEVVPEEGLQNPQETIGENSKALQESEATLDAAAELVSQDMLANSEKYGDDNSFTEAFDSTGTARDRGLSGPIGRKANAGLMANALLEASPATKRKLRKLWGDDVYDETMQAAKNWKAASAKNTPTAKATVVAEAAVANAETVRMNKLEKLFPGIKQAFKAVSAQAEKISKAIPGVSIQIIDTPQRFGEIANRLVGENKGPAEYMKSRGMVHKGVIYINLAKADATTLPHEAAHLVFNKFFGERSQDALMMHNVIINVLEQGTDAEKALVKKLERFVDQYKGGKYEQAEEFFAELVGWLVANESKISLPRKKTIKEMLNNLMYRFTGLKVFNEERGDFRDVIDFVNTVADSLQKGIDPVSKLADSGIVKTDAEIGPRTKFQNSIIDGALEYRYFKDDAKFRELVENGTITQNRVAADFRNRPLLLHSPDNNFSGSIMHEGVEVFRGQGGIFYPLLFDGNFWASTAKGASDLLGRLQKVQELNGGGSTYMGLTGSPNKKIIGNSNSSTDIFNFLQSDFFKFKNDDFKRAYTKGAKALKVEAQNEVDILNALKPENSSFEQRNAFFKGMIEDLLNSKERVAKFEKVVGRKNLSFKGVRDYIAGMLIEPHLKEGNVENKLYAVLELSNVSELNLGDSPHDAYPSSITYDSNGVFKLHMLQDRVHKDHLGITPVDGDLKWDGEHYSTKPATIKKNGGVAPLVKSKDSIYPPSSGLSVPVKIEPKFQKTNPLNESKPIIENYKTVAKALTDDGEGNFVFKHFSSEKRDFIDPNKMGSNTRNITSKDELSEYTYAPVSMYYVNNKTQEAGVGNVPHEIKIPKGMVYPFNKDPLNFYDEAKERYQKAWGYNRAFGFNAQLAWVTKVASENGFLMTVANWETRAGKGFRAQSSVPLKEGVNTEGVKFQKPYERRVGDAERLFRQEEEAKAPGARAFNNPVDFVRGSADRYKRERGLDDGDVGIVTRLDKAAAQQIGQLYDEAVDSPNDPEVRAAYEAMLSEIVDQYEHMLDDGMTVTKGEPYNSALEMIDDIRNNKNLRIEEKNVTLTQNNTGSTQNFFSDVVEGISDKFKAKKSWKPILEFSEIEDRFQKIYNEFKGNFDNHIGTSIPTFRETQVKVGSALVEMLNDSPQVVNDNLVNLKDKYKSDQKLDNQPVYTKVDQKLMDRMANYHDKVQDDRQNPVMKKSYRAFLDETKKQYEYLVAEGYTIEPWMGDGEPYGVNSNLLRDDILNNKHIYYLRSRSATGEDSTNESAENYIPFESSGIVINGDDVLYNDLFRAVHDIFGHTMLKNSFSTQGELDAYNTHAPMYSEQAQKALFLETVVYNAYYNKNKKYAPRKIYDVPMEFMEMVNEKPLLYDIGGSEGGFVKAITKASGQSINTINLDVNESMEKSHNSKPVEGSVFVKEAFYEAYTDESTGKVYPKHVPKKKADVVHESMVFQFITPERKQFIQEIKKNYLKDDGIVLLEEKLTPKTHQEWVDNETKKNAYKAQYYTQEEITQKAEQVLTGMAANQTSQTELINNLEENFKHVSQYWDGGNFKGFIASDSKTKVDEFLKKLGGEVTSEYSSKTKVDKSSNPLLKNSGFKDSEGNVLTNNDLLKATHNYFGHGVRGNDSEDLGKENAWDEHVRMFTPLAARAFTAETRGQNSWANFSGVNDDAKDLYNKARELRAEGKMEEAAAVREQANAIFRFADQKMTLLPEWVSQPTEGQVKFQQPRQPNDNARNKTLSKLAKNMDKLKLAYPTPEILFNTFKDVRTKEDFNKSGVTLLDIQHLYKGLDPNKSVTQYAAEAEAKVKKLEQVLEQAGLSKTEREAVTQLYSEVATAWANTTGRSTEEWWSDIIEDFKFAASQSDIPSSGTVSYQADQVKKSIWDKLKAILPFTSAKKYDNQLQGNTVENPSTPLEEDRGLESDPAGVEFMNKNRDVIRGARVIGDNHKAIVYVTSSANVSTPVHELAHIYEMYMPVEDRDKFLEQVGKQRWDTNVSETFAIGFERFLSDGRTTDNKALQEVFNNFKDWLRQIYNGLFKWGGNDIFLNEKINEVYSKMFNETITNLDKFEKATKKFVNEIRTDGVKFNKETMTEMADLLGFDLENPYVRGTLNDRAARAVSSGLVDLPLALQTAKELISDDRRNPGSVSISPQQAIAFDFLAGKLQKQAIEIANSLQQDPRNPKLLLDLQNTQESIALILSAVSLGNSSSAAVLGAASKRIRTEWFSPEALTARIKKANRDVTDQELRDVVKLAQDVQKAEKNLKEYRENAEKRKAENTIRELNRNLRSIFKIPAIKRVLDELSQSPKPIKELEAELLKELNNYYRTQFSSGGRTGPPLIQTIVAVLQANPDINSVKDLTDYMQARVPGVSSVEIMEILRIEESITGPKSAANKQLTDLERQKKDLEREVTLVETLKDLLKAEITSDGKTGTAKTKSQRLLERTIEELKALALQNSNSHNFAILFKYIDDIEKLYNDSLEAVTETVINGNIVKFGKADINSSLLNMVEEYLQSRFTTIEGKKQSLREKIEDMDAFISDINALKNGTPTQKQSYTDILRRINEQNLQEEEVVDAEYFRLKAELRNKKMILNEKAAEVSEKWVNKILREVANTPRALILSFDYSFMNYQLGFYTMKNLLSPNFFRQIKLLGNTFRASISDTHFEKMEEKFRNTYGSDIEYAKQYGLQIPDRGDESNPEEILRTKTILERVFNVLPYNPIKGIRNFNERGYVTYVGAMRMQEFMSLSKDFSDPDIKRDIAERVNTFTGASRKFGNSDSFNDSANKVIDAAAYPLIAPRLYVSIFKSLYNLTNGPTIAKLIANRKDPELKRYYTRQIFDNMHIIVAQGLSVAAIAGLTNAMDDDEEDEMSLDPYVTSFMRIQVGEKTITVSPYASYVKAAVRLATKALVELQGGDFHTKGFERHQTFGSAVWDEFFKFRMNPMFGSYDLLVNKQDFLDRTVETETLGDRFANVYTPALAPISVQNMVKNINSGTYGDIPVDFMTDMLGVSSYKRDGSSAPDYEKHMSSVDFNYRTKYPKFITSEAQKSLFKQKALEAFSNEVNALLKSGQKPTKDYLTKLKNRIHKQVEDEMR